LALILSENLDRILDHGSRKTKVKEKSRNSENYLDLDSGSRKNEGLD